MGERHPWMHCCCVAWELSDTFSYIQLLCKLYAFMFSPLLYFTNPRKTEYWSSRPHMFISEYCFVFRIFRSSIFRCNPLIPQLSGQPDSRQNLVHLPKSPVNLNVDIVNLPCSWKRATEKWDWNKPVGIPLASVICFGCWNCADYFQGSVPNSVLHCIFSPPCTINNVNVVCYSVLSVFANVCKCVDYADKSI